MLEARLQRDVYFYIITVYKLSLIKKQKLWF